MPFITEADLDPISSDSGAPASGGGGGLAGIGGRFITEADLDPIAPQLSGGQKFAGGIANMVPLNLGDELMAGIRTGVDVFQGKPAQESYDSNLKQIRSYQKAFAGENPKLNVAATIAGSAPLAVAAPTALSASRPLATNLGIAAVEGAGWGAASGFGAGEGISERLASAKKGAKVGAITSPAVLAGGAVIAKGLSKASDDFLTSALNVQRSDLQRAAKFAGKRSPKESPLIPSIREARERGLFKGRNSAEGLVEKNNDFIEQFGDEATQMLKAADAAQTDVTLPTFPSTTKYIAERPFEADALQAQLQKRMQTLNAEWDGSISGLNALKQKLYRISYKNSTESSNLDKAIASDLKSFIEKETDNLLGQGAGDALRGINKKIGEHLTLDGLLQKGKFQNEMPGGLAKGLRRAVVSPIGGGALGGAATLLTGDPRYALAGAAGAALTSRAGQFALSDVARLGAKAGEVGAESAGAIGGMLSDYANTDLQADTAPQPQEREELAPRNTARLTGKTASQKTSGSQSSPNSPRFPSENQASIYSKKPARSIYGADMDDVDFKRLSAAVEQVESAGKADAVSSKGAVGLMQVMPPAYRDVLRANGIDDSQYTDAELKQNLRNPKVNKEVGEAYLQMLLDKYGSEELALAAYNAGMGRVDKLLSSEGDSYADIKDKLPLETRKYVPKIKSIYSKA